MDCETEQPYSGRAWDIYSAGLVIWQMWSNSSHLPFAELLYPWDVRKAVLNREKYIPIPRGKYVNSKGEENDVPVELTQLLAAMWRTNPALRPTASEAYDMVSKLNRKLASLFISKTDVQDNVKTVGYLQNDVHINVSEKRLPKITE